MGEIKDRVMTKKVQAAIKEVKKIIQKAAKKKEPHMRVPYELAKTTKINEGLIVAEIFDYFGSKGGLLLRTTTYGDKSDHLLRTEDAGDNGRDSILTAEWKTKRTFWDKVLRSIRFRVMVELPFFSICNDVLMMREETGEFYYEQFQIIVWRWRISFKIFKRTNQ